MDNPNNVYMVINSIEGNEKRMAKLATIKSGRKLREKAHGYVVAEARALKIKLSADDIVSCVVRIAC